MQEPTTRYFWITPLLLKCVLKDRAVISSCSQFWPSGDGQCVLLLIHTLFNSVSLPLLFLLSTSSSKPNLGGWCRDPWGRIKKKKSSQSLGLGALPSVKVGGMAVHFFKCCKARGQPSWHVLSPLLWGEEADEEEIQLFQSTSALCPAGACEGGGPTQRQIQEESMGGWGGARGGEESYKWGRKALYVCTNVI